MENKDITNDVTYRALLYKTDQVGHMHRDIFYNEETGVIGFDLASVPGGSPQTSSLEGAEYVAKEALKLVESAEGFVILECKPIRVVSRKEITH